jgi:hypothetical protein
MMPLGGCARATPSRFAPDGPGGTPLRRPTPPEGDDILRSANHLHGYRLRAVDGEIGRLDELLVEDGSWTVRWVVADTGGWIDDRRTLISPLAVTGVEDDEGEVSLSLTREQVEHSPPITHDEPVSRAHEAELMRHYGWPVYWGGLGAWGPALTPEELLTVTPPEGMPEPLEQGDQHLQSSRDLVGCHIAATDGEIGHVDDLLCDDASWRVSELVVATRNWLPGRKVCVSTDDVTEVDWVEGIVRVSLTRDAVRHAPEPQDS